MNFLHTWAGITIGTLLFTVFWMGTLSVFDQEIDRWMQPETRMLNSDTSILTTTPIDLALIRLQKNTQGTDTLKSIHIGLPRERQPFADVYAKFENSGRSQHRLDFTHGEIIPETLSYGGTGFIFPMHYRLFISGNDLGYFLVGFAAMAMIVLIISGVFIHRKIFADFFTFRPRKKLGRASLDLHNLTGVLALPFHFVISFSGLVIFAGWYASLPWLAASSFGVDGAEKITKLYNEINEYTHYDRGAAGETAEMVSIDKLVLIANAAWTERYGNSVKADSVAIEHIGDLNAYVSVQRLFPKDKIEMDHDLMVFDAVTGAILYDRAFPSSVHRVASWLRGLHFIQFDHWVLRWLYFFGGLAGCVMIATGFVFWVAARRKESVETTNFSIRLVESVGIGSVSGIIVATGALFVGNRLLTNSAVIMELERPDIEVWSFFTVWFLTFVHAIFRRSSAWSEQAMFISILSLSAVALNWLTTGDHLIATVHDGYWPVAGVDFVLLVSSFFSGLAALKLTIRKRSKIRYSNQTPAIEIESLEY